MKLKNGQSKNRKMKKLRNNLSIIGSYMVYFGAILLIGDLVRKFVAFPNIISIFVLYAILFVLALIPLKMGIITIVPVDEIIRKKSCK